MTRAILLSLLLLASCSAEDSPYPWFEREWVSDGDSTLAANGAFKELGPEELETLLASFGNLHWRVEDGNLQAIYPSEPRYNLQSNFSIQPIDERRFGLLTESGTHFTISGDDSGFCATPENNNESVECFVPLVR